MQSIFRFPFSAAFVGLAVSASPVLAAAPVPSITINPAGPITLNAPEGGVSPGKVVKIKNTSAASLSLGSMVISGADAGDFQLSFDACTNHVLAPKKSCSMTVIYIADGAPNSIHPATLEAQDPTSALLASVQLSGKTKKGATGPISATVNGNDILTIRNNSTVWYEIQYFFLGSIDENPGAGPHCYQGLFITAGDSCSIPLVATGCQDTKGARVGLQGMPVAGGPQYNTGYTLKKALKVPSYCP